MNTLGTRIRSQTKILVVEDEGELRRLVSTRLRNLGYDVTAVATGTEALHVLSLDDTFDLLFADVVLPDGVGGLELAERALRAFGTTLKVLLTSGYPSASISGLDSKPNRLPFLRKPYRRGDLERAVQDVLALGAFPAED
jgi:CheY-like chemotaxis protein